ncbi:methyltransferase [Candidatus Gracilibacteria bacterium]|nr:methyltransferase [Candidatus Gracilibacteria bacterium]
MTDYYNISEVAADLADTTIRFATKPGLADGDRITPGEELLAELGDIPPAARVASFGCGNGALVAALAARLRGGRISALDPSWIAVQIARRTLRLNGATNAEIIDGISFLPAGAKNFDRVLIQVPQSRVLLRRWLLEAQRMLVPGGRLYLAGPRDGGAQAAIDDAQALFGQAAVIGYRKGWRVAEALAPLSTSSGEPAAAQAPMLPAWVEAPGIAPGSWIELDLTTPFGRLQLVSLPGIFAAHKLDAGTALLLEQLYIAPNTRVLDIGCGYGILGIAALRAGAVHADLVDVDLHAVTAATENVRRMDLAADVLVSDGLQAVADRRYDLVVSNPPFHTGKTIDERMAHAFIAESRKVLNTDGRLLLVANRFLPYQRVLAAHFSQIERIAETSAYHVLAAQ